MFLLPFDQMLLVSGAKKLPRLLETMQVFFVSAIQRDTGSTTLLCPSIGSAVSVCCLFLMGELGSTKL